MMYDNIIWDGIERLIKVKKPVKLLLIAITCLIENLSLKLFYFRQINKNVAHPCSFCNR